MSECTARFRLLNVGFSGLREWCMHRSPSLGLRLTWRPPRPAAKCANPSASSTSQKFSKNFFLFYTGGEKFIKGVFARLSRLSACSVTRKNFHRQAKPNLPSSVAWLGETPPTQSSLCARASTLRVSAPCAQGLLFPKRKGAKKTIDTIV